MANRTGKGNFQKGDARINRKGRPKDFSAFRKLAQEIAHEEAQANGKTLIINGKIVTVSEAILRKWATSNDARLQMKFIAVAYGEVPQEVNSKEDVKQRIIIEYADMSIDPNTSNG